MQTQIIYVSPLGNIRLTAEDDALIEASLACLEVLRRKQERKARPRGLAEVAG